MKVVLVGFPPPAVPFCKVTVNCVVEMELTNMAVKDAAVPGAAEQATEGVLEKVTAPLEVPSGER